MRGAPERPPTSLARARRRLAGEVVIGTVDFVGAAMLDLEPMRIPMMLMVATLVPGSGNPG